MRKTLSVILIFLLFIACDDSIEIETRNLPGISQPVEIIRDKWGMNHIYAQNQRDLFFAQGYAAAKDRLFQFEIWRRQATGTIAEILGERELDRDIGTRLFKFRGDMQEEMNYYHPDGEEIITAFVDGVNAYIAEAMKKPDNLPLPFHLLGIQPQKWTPEIVISRHQGLLGNINQELNIGRAVAAVGPESVQKYTWFHPREPNLNLDPSITKEMLDEDILRLYNAYRQSVKYQPGDIMRPEWARMSDEMAIHLNENILSGAETDWTSMGSNNWVISGSRTSSGNTMMANDPHRTIVAPSLRYMTHLVAPGWNVIGGGEPEIPGISIGHNDHGAWGLTVYRTDGEDLYVYDLNPSNLNQYRYKDEWRDMKVISEKIPVKDLGEVDVTLRYTHHGPVTFIDTARTKGYAVRCAWMEPGGAPYLASLRMDQAKNWEEFREACNYSHIPGENMVWADIEGNIGWQAVGIAPLRRNFSGMVPVPGDGRYEWDGYLPIIEKPNVLNPPEGYFATANENVTPESYDKWDAIGYSWSDPFRGDRIREVLSSNDRVTLDDMKALQTDYYSKAAEALVPYLRGAGHSDITVRQLRESLDRWDFVLDTGSIHAAIYVAWENELRRTAVDFLPGGMQPYYRPQLNQIRQWFRDYKEFIGLKSDRNTYLSYTFEDAVRGLEARLGTNYRKWKYGSPDNKHILIRHPLSAAVNDSIRNMLEAGPFPRGGNGYTPGATSNNLNQSSGASFKILVDVGNWDAALGTNTPGQSGDPGSRFYKNTFEIWAKDEYFPLYFSRKKIMKNAAVKTTLNPINE